VQSVGAADVTGSEPDTLDALAESPSDRSKVDAGIRLPPQGEASPRPMASDVDEEALTRAVEGLTLK
jgi:hypothetical protein